MKSTVRWRLAQALEIRWWKRYLRSKEVGSYLEWKRGYWAEFLQPVRPFMNETGIHTVLDAGCGPAGIFTILGDYRVTAVDPLLDAYESALDHFDPERYAHVHFVQSPMESYRTDDAFDMVFCLNALNHVSDIEAALNALMDALRPGGLLLLSLDCHRYRFLKTLFRWIPGDALHPHQFDLAEYEAMTTAKGATLLGRWKTRPGRIFDYWTLLFRKD